MSERLTRTVRAIGLSLSLLMPMGSIDAAGWEELPPIPEPNGGAICGAVGSRIVVVGGTNWAGGAKNWLRAVHEYDPAQRVWTTVRDWEEGPVAYAIGFQNAAGFEFIGGSDGTKALKRLATVDSGGRKLQSIPALPSSLVLAAGGAVGGRYVIVGGTHDAADVAGVQRTTHLLGLVQGQWKVTRMADYPGKELAVAASAVAGDELFVFGGMNWDADAATVLNTAEAHAFSPAKNSWRKVKALAAATRGLSGVALDRRHIYLAGGFTDAFSAKAFLYDVEADSYQPAKPLPYAAMVSLVKSGDYLYCIGGEDRMKARTDKFYRIPVTELLK